MDMAKKKKDGVRIKKNPLEKFAEKGKLQPNAVYYFDPPLESQEMYQLQELFKNLRHGNIVTRPLNRDSEDQRLLWVETDNNGDLESWQNPESDLRTRKDCIRFYRHENGIQAFYDGRELLNTPSVSDIFDKLHENRTPITEIGSKRAKDTNIIYRDKNMIILVPLSYESAQTYSRGTQYCTGGDCSSGSEGTGKSMFKHHSKIGDILYRIIFKDGTKVRLTWNGDINDKNFHWGLGRKDSYPAFTSRNMSNPFDLDMISDVRNKQLEFKKKLGSKIEDFDKWKDEFFGKMGVKNWYNLTNKFENEGLSYEEARKKGEEVMKIYYKKRDDIFGELDPSDLWWNEGRETLYQAIHSIPNEAISKMVEYVGDKKHKVRIPESREDDLDWAKQSITVLPGEFVISFCDFPLVNKRGNIREESYKIFDFLKEIIKSQHPNPQESDIEDLDISWFRHAIRTHDSFVMYFDTNDGVLDWVGWDTCRENSVKHYEYVFPIDMFIEIYGKGKKKKLKEQEGDDEFQWVKDLGFPKGIDRSQLNRISRGNHTFRPIRLEDLRPGLIVKRPRGQFLYEVGHKSTFNIGGKVEEGYMLNNLTNGRAYFTKNSQLVREFHQIIIDSIK